MSATVRIHKRPVTPTVRAVVDDGVLRLLDAVNIPNGRTIEVSVVTEPAEAERIEAEEILAFEKALDDLEAVAAEQSEEWWDEFQRELVRNRFHIGERS